MMTLGVVPGTKDIKWALLSGTQKKPNLIEMEKKTQKLPVDGDETNQLFSLKRLVDSLIREKQINKIAILAAVKSQHGNPSPKRVKVEGVFQITAKEAGIAVELVSPNTLRAKEKKFSSITGNFPENVLNKGNDFKPKPWRDAVLVGWIGLEE